MANVVKQWVKTSSGSTAAFATTTAGSLLIALLCFNSGTVTVATAKTPNNTFAAITGTGITSGGVANATGAISAAMFFKANVTAETTPTFTATWSGTAPTTITIDLFEITGADGTFTNGSAANGKGTSVTVTSFTPAYANALIVGNFVGSAAVNVTGTQFAGGTNLVTPNMRSGYVIQTTAAAFTTLGGTGTGNTNYAGIVVAFRPLILTLPALSMSLN